MQRKFKKAVAAQRGARLSVSIFLLAWLGGCATPPVTPPVSAPEPVPVVAILVSDQLAVYQQVADALGARLDRARVYALDGDEDRARRVVAQLRADRADPVVAIGSLATRMAPQLSDRSIVFCLDFTPVDRRAVGAGVRGVHAMPPAFKQLQAWKMLDPRLQDVTLITGFDKSEFAREARAAGRQLEIDVDHVEVQSDRELLYAVKYKASGAQGLWLAPDSRVLSSRVLREVLAHSVRHGRQTLVFSPQLLDLGALISVDGDPEDIAERVLEHLRAADSPRMLSLRRARTRINMEVAEQLGLAVPPALQGGLYVF